MIYLCTASYIEAKPIIQWYKLKKNMTEKNYQLFEGVDIRLLITGVGMIEAACAVTYLITKYCMSKEDSLINLGIAGSNKTKLPIGTIVLVNKIIDYNTKKAYYPDIIYRHDFIEDTLITCSTPVYHQINYAGLVDMEGTAIYQAANKFLSQHQIQIIKVVSDYLKPENITKELVEELINSSRYKISYYIDNLKEKSSNIQVLDVFTEEENDIITRIMKNLHFSKAMRTEIKQYIVYYKIREGDISPLINMEKIQVKNKREGKIYFEQLKNNLLA